MTTRTLGTLAGASRSLVLAQAAGLLFAGLLLVFLTGFAHSEVLHDAAHDTRHALSFPCH